MEVLKLSELLEYPKDRLATAQAERSNANAKNNLYFNLLGSIL